MADIHVHINKDNPAEGNCHFEAGDVLHLHSNGEHFIFDMGSAGDLKIVTQAEDGGSADEEGETKEA